MPKMAFVEGQEERSILDESVMGYSRVGNDKKSVTSLWNQGFDIAQISLESPVPDDITLLVMAAPRELLTETEWRNLTLYLDRGDDMLLLLEPEYREITNEWTHELLGVEVTPLLVQERKIEPQVLVCPTTEEARKKLYRLTKAVCLPMGGGIEVVANRGFELFPIATCDGWTELETSDFLDDMVCFNSEAGEVKKQFNTLLGLHRVKNGKKQRIIVVGDVDCLSNGELEMRRNNVTYNSGLIISLCNWLSDGEAPINVNRMPSPEVNVHVTEGSYKFMQGLFVFAIPLCVLGLYFFVWLRRRSR